METELTFEYLLQYFLIAHSKNFPKGFKLENSRIKITLFNYVASQLHLNVISSFYTKAERDIYQYNTAYHFLSGANKGKEDTLKVLNFFFQDTYMYLMKSSDVYYVNLVFDQEQLGIKLEDSDVNKVKIRLIRFIKTALGDSQGIVLPMDWQDISSLQEHEFLELSNDKAFAKFTEILAAEQISIEDVINRIDNYAQAICFIQKENEMNRILQDR